MATMNVDDENSVLYIIDVIFFLEHQIGDDNDQNFAALAKRKLLTFVSNLLTVHKYIHTVTDEVSKITVAV